MMKKILAKTSNRRYPIYIRRGISRSALKLIKGMFPGSHKLLLVTNDSIYSIYREMLEKNLASDDLESHIHTIKEGETYKSLDSSRELFDVLLKHNFHRNDLIVAFGGGVIGDLVGFAASTYHRGTNLVQYPTTIIGQVDSSIGGKVAVNYRDTKNIIGTFYQPHMIIMDPALLNTLDDSEIVNGLGEVIKYGLIFDSRILDALEKLVQRQEKISSITASRLFEDIIYRCARIKAAVVSKDEFDTGHRNLLNFGHTIGHALEKASGLTEISHGRAISLGMLVALDISAGLGSQNADLKKRMVHLYKKVGLPARIAGPGPEQLLEAAGFDKKFTSKKNKFVLLKALNRPFFYHGVPEEIIINAIKKNMG